MKERKVVLRKEEISEIAHFLEDEINHQVLTYEALQEIVTSVVDLEKFKIHIEYEYIVDEEEYTEYKDIEILECDIFSAYAESKITGAGYDIRNIEELESHIACYVLR